jgi:UDPglucose 6-dehydrogenase
LGFLKDTNDTRESAAIYVADDLINENAIAVYDP